MEEKDKLVWRELVNIYWLEERTDKDRPQVEERE